MVERVSEKKYQIFFNLSAWALILCSPIAFLLRGANSIMDFIACAMAFLLGVVWKVMGFAWAQYRESEKVRG